MQMSEFNQNLINTLAAKLNRGIEFLMNERGFTYAQAKENIKESSCAGPAVWEVLDNLHQGEK